MARPEAAVASMEADMSIKEENTKPATTTPAAADAMPAKRRHKLHFVLKSAGDKGHGMFAKTKLEKATMILVEKPIIFLGKESFCYDSIQTQYEHLSLPYKTAYMNLSSAHDPNLQDSEVTCGKDCCVNKMTKVERRKDDQRWNARRTDHATVHSIFETNAMTWLSGAGVGLVYSRINHDCCPNAKSRWNEETKRIEVRLIRAVDADEEITIDYLLPIMPPCQRRHLLSAKYNFTCTCKACLDYAMKGTFAHVSNRRRLRIARIDQIIEDSNNSPAYQYDYLLESMRLHEEEGVVTAPLYYTARSVSLLARKLDEPNVALKAAKLALHLAILFTGGTSSKTECSRKALHELLGWLKERRFRAAANDVLKRLETLGY